MDEARRGYRSAVGTFVELVDAVPPDRWDAPGLGVWSVRALVGHAGRALSTVRTYLDRPAETVRVDTAARYYALARRHAGATDRDAVAERGRQAGAALGDRPAAAVRDLADDVLRRLDAVAGDPVIETIAGGMRLDAYLPTRTFELAAHGLDLAAATGLTARFAPDVLAATCRLAAETAVLLGDGPLVLRALTGRADLPAGYSMV